MALDAQAQTFLGYLKQAGMQECHVTGYVAARQQRDPNRLPPGPAARVENREIEGPGGPLPIRIYHPEQGGQRGALVFFHGGGFVIGTLDGHDNLCRQLCADAGCVVVSVDYRLAPEHKFPSAVEDAYAATVWVHAHAAELEFDPGKLAVGGDSAGGNLTAAVSMLAKQRGGPKLALQALLYPATDLRTFDRPSSLENAEGKLLSRADMIWFTAQYLRDDRDRHDPLASPLAATDLSGLPPALVITAEHDPLRDEGNAYAEALRAAGNSVQLTCYPGTIHGFMSLYAFLDQGKAAVRECSEALKAALA
ncbi:MAG TPA: alpha/beta hydrolase [Polyangiales bacterium]|nr:alpha/beta hydrolase [Polyangiales bacterium]